MAQWVKDQVWSLLCHGVNPSLVWEHPHAEIKATHTHTQPGNFFSSLVQFIFLCKLSIHLRFDHALVCLINPFSMEKYFWTLTQPDRLDTIKPTAHDHEMQVSKQQSRTLTPGLHLASHGSHFCPTLRIA